MVWHYIWLTVIGNVALVFPCDVDRVFGFEQSPDTNTCGVVGLWLGYDEQGHSPNVLLAARATTNCLLYQIAAPSAAAFLLRAEVNGSAEQFLQHMQRKRFSRRLINSNDLDIFVSKRLLQSATEIRRLAKSADEEQVLVMSLT